ncbi:hypothetical protein [Flagellimonas allohymeniacidonis]|uniref:Uncharacterized protein n=1 Tax=Flagellimonas allohymeniacidonis TaxID=2517819 RepID=A0A4Q8Q912_9FLAO|nr:hypothetical protein [Allomuricauda hymeniacidonis]TAI46681.1 hypothetical protein EW142_16540 [Allomuricauda hymeniacidonis]
MPLFGSLKIGVHKTFGPFLLLCLLNISQCWGQAPSTGDLIKVHEASQPEINSLTNPEEGMLIYNEDTKQLNFFEGSNWVAPSNTSKTLVLNRASNGNNNLIVNSTNQYYDLPVNASHEINNTGGIFQTIGNGRIRVVEAGAYFMSAAFSVRDMPSGDTKYIIGVFINGTLRGYLTRGFASLPSSDWWGTSGTIIYPLSANDEVRFRYVVNNNGNPLDAVFINIGITQL